MEQTRGLFCMCDLGVAGCQSQHQCHFLEAIQEASIQEAMNGCKNVKIH